jgi:hypothetical protein
VPIHEAIRLQFVGEAFNLFNNRIITGVNSTVSLYTGTAAPSSTVGTVGNYCPSNGAAPSGSALQGCIYPNTATGASAFGAPSATGNSLVGARQLQVSAKLFF